MELYTLDSELQLNNPVENYASLIWTERYGPAGDFQLVTSDIAKTIQLLPRESFVALRDSTEVMVVEDYKIGKPIKDKPTIVVVGRTFETVLERRASRNTPLPASYSTVPTWIMAAAKESDAAYKAMRVVLGDVSRYSGSTMVLSVVNPAVSPLDAISEIDLTLPADYSTDTTNNYEIKPGRLYDTVLELLSVNHRGIKSVRPLPGSSKIGIEIYNGADLTETVAFDTRFDQFDDATYLLSERGSTNVGYFYGSNGGQVVQKNTGPEPSGLSRRVLDIDQASDTSTSTTDVRRTRGLIELYKHNATALFAGQISEQAAAGYNKTYFLGDIVNEVGEFGLSQKARVAEFVRSSDSSGYKAYPTFEAVDE